MFTEADYVAAAARLGVPEAAVRAVADVESNGVTNWADGRPPILFEAQWFSSLTGHRYDASHPGISSTTWNRALYIGGPAEYGRLAEATTLDRDAAMQSASWGAFQIMGLHWQELGYASPQAFVDAQQQPAGQLDAFVRFIRANPPIEDALRRQDWQAFALHYNGTGQVDYYAGKIADAYAHQNGPAPSLPPATMRRGAKGGDVAKLQGRLRIGVDGDFGAETEAAVRAFQAAAIPPLKVDGVVGPATRAALGI